MDAVEAVMRDDGYAALSARSIGARAGLNYQLVFYYFEKIDNLLLATYRRRTKRLLARVEQALTSERPFHALWDASRDPVDGALSLEYMAMSNHVPVIHEETVAHMQRMLAVMVDTTKAYASRGPSDEIFSPVAVAMLVATVGESMSYQSALGIASEIASGPLYEPGRLVEWILGKFETSDASTRDRDGG
jgi:AcrR family transcriptional regulator